MNNRFFKPEPWFIKPEICQ